MPIDRDKRLMVEKEKTESSIKITLRTNQSKFIEVNKKIKASIEENCINFFLLNLVSKKLCTNSPEPKIKIYKLDIKELIETGTLRVLK